MEQLKTLALVTRSMNWRETSKIVTLFTREAGRLDVIVKGARKKNSAYIGIIETLNLVEALVYYSSRRELQILGKVSLEDSFHILRADLKKTAYAFCIIELINIFFIHADSEPVFFDFLVYIIKFIEQEDKAELAFWYFILKLTSFLGFRPQFNKCYKCGKENLEKKRHFSFSNGAVICKNCQNEMAAMQNIDGDMLLFFENLQKTNYRKLSQVRLPENYYQNYTDFLLEYLRYHTDQKLILHGLSLLA
jgi:DNA repair protein RecO (recombination protein O)